MRGYCMSGGKFPKWQIKLLSFKVQVLSYISKYISWGTSFEVYFEVCFEVQFLKVQVLRYISWGKFWGISFEVHFLRYILRYKFQGTFQGTFWGMFLEVHFEAQVLEVHFEVQVLRYKFQGKFQVIFWGMFQGMFWGTFLEVHFEVCFSRCILRYKFWGTSLYLKIYISKLLCPQILTDFYKEGIILKLKTSSFQLCSLFWDTWWIKGVPQAVPHVVHVVHAVGAKMAVQLGMSVGHEGDQFKFGKKCSRGENSRCIHSWPQI